MALKCGVAGLKRGKLFADRFDRIEGCETVAVCDMNPASLEPFGHLKTFTDYESFIREGGMDVVAVITPGPVHADQSIMAMDAGKHVICETPFVYSIQEAERLVQAVERTGMKFMLAEDYIWMGFVERCREMIEEGKLGEIVYAEGDYTHDCRDIMLIGPDGGYVKYKDRGKYENLRLSWRGTDFPPVQYCSHTLGPLLHLMRDRCVTAIGLHSGSHTAPDLGTIDMEVAIFKTAGNAIVRLTNGFTIAHPYATVYNLCGTHGSLKFSRAGEVTTRFYTDVDGAGAWESIDLPWSERRDGRDWVLVMLEEYVDSVRRDTKPPLDVYESLECTLPGICAHLSAEQDGRPVPIPDLRPEARAHE